MMTLVACFLLVVSTTSAQTLKIFFDKYSNDNRFEYVSVGKGMLTMAKMFGDVDDAKDMQALSKIKGLKVLTLTDGFDNTLQKKVLKELDEVIKAGNFESLVEVREKTERVSIYCQITEKDDADMLVVTRDDSELSLIWLKGKLTADELMGILDN